MKKVKVKVSEENKETKKRGIVSGYKPNRLSLYILLLNCGRLEELNEVLIKDMEQYKEEVTND